MATQEEHEQNVLSRSGRQVFIGDLERRRPTKRMTTVRSFAVVRNWANQQNEEQSNEVSPSNVQSAQISSRTDVAYPEHKSPELSHEPLGFQDVQPMSDDGDDDVQIPSISDDDDVPALSASDKNNVVAGPSSDVSHDASAEFDDVRPMVVDGSPVKAELPQHASVESSLPAGKETVSKTVLDNTLKKSSSRKQEDNHDRHDKEDSDDDDDDDLNIFEEKTPLRNKSPPQSVGLKSGLHSKQPRSVARKRVVFERRTKENKQPRFDEEEYEAQNFVRLFNADRGRKGGATDVTDLDIVLTNIEEVALEIKSKTDSAVHKKLVREAFIQIRQIFSDTIDIYKEKKYLHSATTKTNSKIKKMRQELLDIQDKRKEAEAKLNKLKSECNTMEKRIKSKDEAYYFLAEFEKFQDNLRKSDTGHTSKEECRGDESLPSLLCEASGYLSTERQLRNINDKLQLWLDKNNT